MTRNIAPVISAAVSDCTRERKLFFSWDPSRSLLASIKDYQRHIASRNPINLIGREISVVRHRF